MCPIVGEASSYFLPMATALSLPCSVHTPLGPLKGKREWGRAVVGEKGSEAPLLESPTLQHQPQQLLDLRLYLLGRVDPPPVGQNGKGEWGRLKRAAEALPLLAPVGPSSYGAGREGMGVG
ncbi:unnamed protein product, partial [Closterium sp. NIES-65]